MVAPPDLVARYRTMNTGMLRARLGIARITLMHAQKAHVRTIAMSEIEAIRNELLSRGEKVPA